LNPRPTDYEAGAAEMPPSQSFCLLPRIVPIWLALLAVTRSNHELQQLQETSRDQPVFEVTWRKRAQERGRCQSWASRADGHALRDTETVRDVLRRRRQCRGVAEPG